MMKASYTPAKHLSVGGRPITLQVMQQEDGSYFGLCQPVNLTTTGASIDQVQERILFQLTVWLSPAKAAPQCGLVVDTPGWVLRNMKGHTTTTYFLVATTPDSDLDQLLGQNESDSPAWSLLAAFMTWSQTNQDVSKRKRS